MKGGYLGPIRLFGVSIRMHLTAPLGPVLFSGFRLDPGLVLGVVVVLLVHELGHVLVAKARGCEVVGIDLHAIGGTCRIVPRNRIDDPAIAWGGILAQAWLCLVTVIVARFVRVPAQAATFVTALVDPNLYIVAVNLLPIDPIDGAAAFRLFGAIGWFRREPRHDPDLPIDPEDEARTTAREALERAKRDAMKP